MSWLCPTELDQRRAVDTSDRVRKARTFAAACGGIGILVVAPILSWWLVPLFVLSAVDMLTVDLRMRRAEHPERVPLTTNLVVMSALAVGAALTGGPASPVLPWLAVPVAMSAARFGEHVVKVLVAVDVAMVLAVGLAVDAHELFANPALTVVTISLICSVAGAAVAIQGAEMQHREESVLDPLTGLLNRKSLLPRFHELQHQARRQRAPICMIAADLDHFKEVNDTFGHETGDTVLQAAAYEMRKSLRSFELFYRLGGEEFLAVIPGAGIDQGRELAERMRAAVQSIQPSGVEVTVSLGVAVASEEQLEFEELFNAADQALYEAKRAGRNGIAAIEVLREADPHTLEQLVALDSIRRHS
ncbi:MAG: GGDEF domain-containing protein [Solirubrobacterales bacterium]